MSWQPADDPILGDKRSCDALELVVVARSHDLGGFNVRRALPTAKRRLVGPFVFLDQMGPSVLASGTGVDVRPHPHIGLSTLTYLFEGAIMHRDSLGVVQEIKPAEVNWMTAGRGIVHSERTPAEARAAGPKLHGLQAWVALPASSEETDPGFAHIGAADFPVVEDAGARVRLVAGEMLGAKGQLATHSPAIFADVDLAAGASVPLDATYEERAVYVVSGAVDVAGDVFEAGQLLVFRVGDRMTLKAANGPARLCVLGGDALEGPRYIWWNFVSSRRERIEEAKAQWTAGRFTMVPGEHEHIPLPERWG
jgi:redox-sensitive bicupin YhaK (pirin superfamily)